MQERRALTSAPIDDLLAKRWSPRAFDASRRVSRAQLRSLLEAARWAPSCNGDEPYRYIVIERQDDADAWAKMFDCLNENNRKWFKNVPLVLISCAGSKFSHNGNPNRWGQHDVGAASICLALQAVSLGLAAHQAGGWDMQKLRKNFEIPDEYTPMAIIAVGYQAEPDVLDEETKQKELRPRGRKPIEEHFYEAAWGAPVKL